eukprot:COSAG04_NODE_598_length_12236_cov_8.196342_7_plen_108_part_00
MRGERTTELCAQSYSTHVPSSPQLSTSLPLPPAATPFTMSLWTMGVGVERGAPLAPLGRGAAGSFSLSGLLGHRPIVGLILAATATLFLAGPKQPRSYRWPQCTLAH